MKNLAPLLLLFLFVAMVHTGFGQSATIDVMPYPSGVTVGTGKLSIASSFTVGVTGAQGDKILETAVNRFFQRLNARTLAYFKQERVILNEASATATCVIQVGSKATPSIGIDESYQLTINAETITLKAATTIGALRGLETLLQLVVVDQDGYYFPAVAIQDTPRFKWRGMMVDAARHFLPVSLLRKQIDAMSMVKLNVLHLHLTDDEGFRVESKTFPKLHTLGSNGRYYTQAELKSIVDYAAGRGIMVVPEFDLPGHTRSWFAGHPELASQPGPYRPGPRYTFDRTMPQSEILKLVMTAPTPTVDPTREEVYQLLDKFIAEMTTIFPAPYIHIGADENNGAAWNSNPKIVQFMKDKGIKDTHELQAYFVKRLYDISKKYKRTMIGWQEVYNANLPKDVIVQAWIASGSFMKAVPPLEIAGKGNQVLISTGSYLDLFLPAHMHYINANIPATVSDKVLGGEAALWSELVDEHTFEERAWPRAASIAERLWSPSSVADVDDMYRRLFILSDRLEEGGLDHRLNIKRMMSQLSNGDDVQPALSVLETLVPLKGYRRLAAKMFQPAAATYETTPLAEIADMAPVDSEVEWTFRRQVETFLKTRDAAAKTQIENKLKAWKQASQQLPDLAKTAPNLKSLAAFTTRLIAAADIGLQALDKPLDETEKARLIKQLNEMKLPTEVVEIRILDEIEGLVSGTVPALPTTYAMF